MKSHSLIRWALVFVISLLLLPAANGAAETGSEPTYQISQKSPLGPSGSSDGAEVGTTHGDPDDVGGGETKTGGPDKPGPSVNNGSGNQNVDAISRLWEDLRDLYANLIRI